ncbi:MAG: AbrB/MazE/SpoVT family DNA-binding domain-containing protein [bacterium]|nr:AbrB/MazE/SpoVT family DNA-binding domain-containing protein [bacterium]
MKSMGIVRKMDDLGRIVLPAELRRQFDIAERDAVEIYTDGDKIVLKKFKTSCVFCDAEDDLISYKDKAICPECIKKISNLI